MVKSNKQGQGQKRELVERVITGDKGIWITDEDGQRRLAQKGETVFLTPRAANTFKERLKAPSVAEAEKAVEIALRAAEGVPEDDSESEDDSE